MTQHRRAVFADSQASNVKKIAVMASTVAFEFNKATLKLRRSLHISPRGSPEVVRKSTECSVFDDSPESTQSTSRRKCSQQRHQHRQLCAELSSFALYPLFGALSPSHFSSPNLLFQHESGQFSARKRVLRLADLSDTDLGLVMSHLNAASLLNLSHTCQRMRRLCHSHDTATSSIRRRDVTSHEICVSFNQLTRRTEVRLLKRDRTRRDAQFTADTIRALLAPFSRALTKITFETTVFVTDWLDELLALHTENRLVPLSLVFTGGALTKGNQLNGADLRAITETEFLEFVARLQPHLQEIQLSTSRIFKMSTKLLGMISVLSSFGVVYERPPLRFAFDEIADAITRWRSDAHSRSCDVYMRRPHDVAASAADSWLKLAGVSIEQSRRDPFTEETLVSRVAIKHSFLVHIDLVFHFH